MKPAIGKFLSQGMGARQGSRPSTAEPRATAGSTTLEDENDSEVAGGPFNGTGLSLREAIALANANPDADTIEFDSSLNGTITLAGAGAAGELDIRQGVTINGDNRIALDGAENSSILEINVNDSNAENIDVILSGITFQNSGGSRGAIHALGRYTGLHVEEVSFIGNSSDDEGGAIWMEGFDSIAGGILSIADSYFSNNHSDGGGALLISAARGYVSGSRFYNNSAREGGTILNTGSKLTIENSNIHSNYAYVAGGISSVGGSLDLTNSVIESNIASGAAGGVLSLQSSLSVVNTTLSGNVAGYNGGAITIQSSSNFELLNLTVSGNSVAGFGSGGIQAAVSTGSISSSTIGFNATGTGIGVALNNMVVMSQ